MASALALSAAFASAETISVGLQEVGVNGGMITTEQQSSTLIAGNFYSLDFGSVSYGTFILNAFNSTDSVSPASLNSQSMNTSSSSPGTLIVYVTQQGVTTPLSSNWLSSFTTNQITNGWTVNEATYYDPGNGLYAETDPLDSATLTSSNQVASSTDPANVTTGMFSLTEVFTITAIAGGGTANDTIDLQAVPEPGTLALLGAGLIGLGFIRRRGTSFRV
jgi:hypothetical protein